jgi:hypothetical protein
MQPSATAYETALGEARLLLDTSDADRAEVKCEEPNLLPVYLLHGYAIENALKAILIHRDPNLIQIATLATKITTHDLTKLADVAAFPLSDKERQFLTWLTEVIFWKGRYNVPREARKLGTFYALDHLATATLAENLDMLITLFGRAEKRLPAQVTQRLRGFNIIIRTAPDSN